MERRRISVRSVRHGSSIVERNIDESEDHMVTRRRDIEGKDRNAGETTSTSSVSERNWRMSFAELKAPRIAHARFPGCDTEYATNRGV